MFHHIELGRSLLGYDLVSNLLQLRVKLLKEILKQQRQELEGGGGGKQHIPVFRDLHRTPEV